MNAIKGLIMKDLLQLKSYKQTLLMFIVIFTCTSIIQKSGDMLVVMLTLGFGMFAMASFNYDESAKADRYILTFPLTKKEIVLSKYIFAICSTIIGAILGMIVSFIITLTLTKQIPNIGELISFGLGGILGLGIVQGIQIPCIYKWGAEKGRLQIFIIATLVLSLGGILVMAIYNSNIQLPLDDISNMTEKFLPLIFIVATVVVYYISYKISKRIYMKKEF